MGHGSYTPALVCLLARDMRDTNQGHLTVDGGLEIGTGGLWLCQIGLARRQSVLACLARGLALTNEPVLDCRLWVLAHGLWAMGYRSRV